MILLHGFGGVHGVWRDLAEALEPECRILAYDLPGHGGSLDFAGGLSAKAAARAILADLAAQGIDRAHVVGHSLGGAVATLIAAQEPQRIASLTLLAPGGYGSEINGAALQAHARATTPDELQTALLTMSGPRAKADPEAVDVLTRTREVPGKTARLIEIATAISGNGRQGVFPPEMLADLRMPVTVLWGTADPVLPYGQTAALPATFRLLPVDGAGHMLIEESPEAVIAAIRRSLTVA